LHRHKVDFQVSSFTADKLIPRHFLLKRLLMSQLISKKLQIFAVSISVPHNSPSSPSIRRIEPTSRSPVKYFEAIPCFKVVFCTRNVWVWVPSIVHPILVAFVCRWVDVNAEPPTRFITLRWVARLLKHDALQLSQLEWLR